MKGKKLLIPIAILLILLLSVIILILIFSKNKFSWTPPVEDEIEIKSKLEPVTVRNDFFSVKNCINKFYTYYSLMYNTYDDGDAEAQQEQSREAVYKMLDKEYIGKKHITLDNITTILPNISPKTIDITDMYVTEKNENISIYFVYGNLIDTSSKQVEKFSIIVKIDMLNRTFKVLLQDYIQEKYPNIKIGDEVEINYEEELPDDTYNIYEFSIITNEIYVKELLKSFTKNMLYNPEEAYQKLNEEYRVKRFPTIEDFKKYIKNNIVDITLMSLEKYQKNRYEDYTQYVCVDIENNYYIINESATLNYNILLDIYTVEIPQFAEEYEKATDIEKVGLNIGKIEQAVNEGDFQYIYSKLDNTYKMNNFSDFSKFENYLKTIVFKENKLEYENIEKKANVYTATVTISNAEGYSPQTNKLNIIMQLKEGTDFVMSFSANN